MAYIFVNRESGIRCEHYTSCSHEWQNCNIESVASIVNLPENDVEDMLSKGRITAYYNHNGEYMGYDWIIEEE